MSEGRVAQAGPGWASPPGWPEPPPGWVPWPGWQPDPTWPPAPEGWVWWRAAAPDPEAVRRRGRRIVAALVAWSAASVVLGLLVLVSTLTERSEVVVLEPGQVAAFPATPLVVHLLVQLVLVLALGALLVGAAIAWLAVYGGGAPTRQGAAVVTLFVVGLVITFWQLMPGPYADLGWTPVDRQVLSGWGAVTVEMWVSLVLCALTVPITAALVELEQRRREQVLGSDEQG